MRVAPDPSLGLYKYRMGRAVPSRWSTWTVRWDGESESQAVDQRLLRRLSIAQEVARVYMDLRRHCLFRVLRRKAHDTIEIYPRIPLINTSAERPFLEAWMDGGQWYAQGVHDDGTTTGECWDLDPLDPPASQLTIIADAFIRRHTGQVQETLGIATSLLGI